MGDTKNEILDAVKLLLGIKDNDKDDVLMLLIDNYDYLKEYAIRLKPFVSRKVKVPSEVIADDKSV